jgi:L-seryl-tRNA(Ser) seleniumtransferase
MAAVAVGYSNLEYDLAAGERGDRYEHAAGALCRLTGAEAAAVVNNNASSVLIALAALIEARRAPTGALAEGAPGSSGRAGRGAPEGGPASPGAADRAALRGETSPGRPEHGGAERREACPEPVERAEGWERPTPAGPPEVVISRGQLVEIGGGFRIPDVLRRSGAALVEVGATNRTRLRDYAEAITPRTAMLLSVHRSNFRQTGFVEDTPLEELVALARERGLWVVDDLGSGTLLETARFGLGLEPTIQERIRAGADLVCFSGDKLLGAPQAGILAGRREAVERVKRHPLMRALRVDKVTLAGLSATLAHYERGEAEREVPVWRAIAQRPEALGERAARWREALGEAGRGCEVLESTSAVGGGSLPGVTLPTRVLALPRGVGADAVLARLRSADTPVVARIEDDRVVLDPRTVMPDEDALVVEAIRGALSRPG